MALATKKSTATRRRVTPQKATPKPKAAPVLKRTTKPRTRPVIDTVRASRDGHEFHEAWVC